MKNILRDIDRSLLFSGAVFYTAPFFTSRFGKKGGIQVLKAYELLDTFVRYLAYGLFPLRIASRSGTPGRLKSCRNRFAR